MQQSGLMGMLLPLAVFVVIFYFLIIRPQKKRQRKHEEMLASIRPGDQVVTAGGFFGTVKAVKEDSYILEIAEGTKARVLKSSIQMKRTSVEDESPAETDASSSGKEKKEKKEKKEETENRTKEDESKES
ncbi:MAG: preprotein translocase subunit YajC [Synergistales bacterium]|nr:preprotein translocase subunit YajC [Synergistales bacterium]MDN5336224.1 preprotein translocase subunit YajC [Synergistales bacterium]